MRPSRTDAELDASRRHLTSVATKIFVRDGIDALSLRNLGAEAGMSRSTPYGYFASKAELVDSVRAAGLDRLTERCAAALAGLEEPLEQMRVLSRAVVRFACDERAMYLLVFEGPVFDGTVSPVVADSVARFRKVSRPPLDEAIRRRLVHGNPDVLRRTTWAAFHGLVVLHLRGHLSVKQLEKDVESMNEMIGFGILSDAARKMSSNPAKTKRGGRS